MELEIELLPGNDLKRVVDFMLEHKNKGRKVNCTFKGIRFSSDNISIDEDTIKIVVDSSDECSIAEIDKFLSECETADIVGMCNYKGAIVVSDNQNAKKAIEKPNEKKHPIK